MKFSTLILFLGVAACKEHFVVQESPKDTRRVRAGTANEKCIFKKPTIDDSSDEDKFCVEYEGSATTGFKWEQDINELDKATNDGSYEINHSIYLKFEVMATISFVLNRLFKAELTLDGSGGTEMEHRTGFKYYIYENDLCMNIVSEINDFEYIT